MNTPQNDKWQQMLAVSSPTFAGEATPPYGLVTSALGRLKAENQQVAEIERIGGRALLASLCALVVAAVLAVSVTPKDQSGDLEPGVKSLVQVENISVS
jgi:hypothetical protein